MRHAKKLGLAQRYTSDHLCMNTIRKFMALPLLPDDTGI